MSKFLFPKIEYLIIPLAFTVLFCANGFILERYFCSGCYTEHKEVALFEFGKLKHDHQPCSECIINGYFCDCCNNEHEHHDNSNVEYVTLDFLFVKSAELKISNQINIITKYFNTLKYYNNLNISQNIFTALFRLYKIPPLINQFKSSKNYCSMLSVFRL